MKYFSDSQHFPNLHFKVLKTQVDQLIYESSHLVSVRGGFFDFFLVLINQLFQKQSFCVWRHLVNLIIVLNLILFIKLILCRSSMISTPYDKIFEPWYE